MGVFREPCRQPSTRGQRAEDGGRTGVTHRARGRYGRTTRPQDRKRKVVSSYAESRPTPSEQGRRPLLPVVTPRTLFHRGKSEDQLNPKDVDENPSGVGGTPVLRGPRESPPESRLERTKHKTFQCRECVPVDKSFVFRPKYTFGKHFR